MSNLALILLGAMSIGLMIYGSTVRDSESRIALLGLPAGFQLRPGSQPGVTSFYCLLYAPFYRLDPRLIWNTAILESHLIPRSIGDGGASFGLCQLQASAIATIQENGSHVPADWQFGVSGNILASCQYAAWLFSHFEIPDPGVFREVWTLGPTKYFKGERNSKERNRMIAAMNGGYVS